MKLTTHVVVVNEVVVDTVGVTQMVSGPTATCEGATWCTMSMTGQAPMMELRSMTQAPATWVTLRLPMTAGETELAIVFICT